MGFQNKLIVLLSCAAITGANVAVAAPSETRGSVDVSAEDMGMVSNGVTVSLIKDFMDVKATYNGESTSDDADQTVGIGLGYNYVRIQDVGFTSRFVYNRYDADEGDDGELYRLDGNMAYGLNSNTYFYGGLNLSRIKEEDTDDSSVSVETLFGVGYQLGIGFQVTPNVGFQFGYGVLNNKARFSNIYETATIDIQLDGFEMALTGTF